MRIDCFIMNPPYNNCQSHNGRIGDKITEEIKNKHSQKYIQIQLINSKMKYKTSEFVCNPFGIRWSNIFIFDMLGNINEYMSLKKMPYWSKTENLRLYARWNYNFDIMDETKTNFSFGNVGKIKENFPNDFLLWLQTNETAQWFRKTFFHINTKTPCVNKLWEIYNERGDK